MAAHQNDTTATVEVEKHTVPKPSGWWCMVQSLKGCNPRKLSIPDADLREKWIIITGGNSGIGREAALQFAKWGANLILGCREPPPRETHPDVVVAELKVASQAAGHKEATIEWWECNMADFKSVEAFGRRWLAKDRPLDILVNNAGIAGLPKANLTVDGFEIVHQVNFISHVLLTLALLPSLARAPEPRIICTTSNMQYSGTFNLKNANAGKFAYANNKLYFQTWLTELQSRLSKNDRYEHIVIHGVHPGYVKTNIWAETPRDFGSRFLTFLLKFVGIDSQQGSLAITYASTAPEWGQKTTANGKVIGGGGRFCNRIWDEVPMPQSKDDRCRRIVWDFVSDELKLREKGLLAGLEV